MNKFIKRLIKLSVMFLRISSSIGTIAKNSVRILLILMGMTWSTLTLAEGGCPEGQFPQQYGTTMGCTTMNAGGNQPLAPVWAKRWGAIATDSHNASVGTVVDMRSKKQAEKAALSECRANGGGKCEVDLAYYNQCAVIITGDNSYLSQGAVSKEEATRIAMQKCQAKDVNCRVYYSGCSMPVRVN